MRFPFILHVCPCLAPLVVDLLPYRFEPIGLKSKGPSLSINGESATFAPVLVFKLKEYFNGRAHTGELGAAAPLMWRVPSSPPRAPTDR